MASSKKNKSSRSGEFDARRWAHATFVVAAFALAWVGSNLVEDLWAFGWSVWPQWIARPHAQTPKVIGGVLALLVTGILWRREEYFRFVCEVAVEVSQVIWPTRAETRAATVVVVSLTLICSCILAVMDTFWQTASDWIYDY